GDKKRELSPGLENRYNSAYFWEERNKWFSDLWADIRGMSQKLNNINGNKKKIRERSAAFPLKLPFRLINMFSIYGDTVLDPFLKINIYSCSRVIYAFVGNIPDPKNLLGLFVGFLHRMHGKTINPLF
ncbi:unnamed protein product, partial [marine sediment metagenome]